MRHLEEQTARQFGGAADPLLVSVRSGAPESMPGMMDTVLNLGLNEETSAGLARATDSAAFARDCRDRFWAMFEALIGRRPPHDVWDQLRAAIEAVFRSWNSERASAYRQIESISDELGSAVTIQAMVFGNIDPDSATGVLFTRDPATGERAPFGDVLFEAQGEDVVSGTRTTFPVAVLDERMPAVATSLWQYGDLLERHFADMCDIEFTIEQGHLWLLQARVGKRGPQAALRMAIEMAEDPAFPLSREQAVRRVASLLASPPRMTAGRPDDAGANNVRAAGLSWPCGRGDRHVRGSRQRQPATQADRSSWFDGRPRRTTSRSWHRLRACSPRWAASRATPPWSRGAGGCPL